MTKELKCPMCFSTRIKREKLGLRRCLNCTHGWKENRQVKQIPRKRIFVCSPLSGEIEKNINNAIQYCKYVVRKGHIPIAPHIYFTRFLDGTVENERNLGMSMGIELLELCDELWVFGGKTSPCMQKEIEHYNKKIKKEIRRINLEEI